MAKRPTDAQGKDVFIRAGGLCKYRISSEDYSNSTFEIEHILPFSKGGKNTLENFALSCSGCNKFKSHRTEEIDPETGKIVALYDTAQRHLEKTFQVERGFHSNNRFNGNRTSNCSNFKTQSQKPRKFTRSSSFCRQASAEVK